MEQNGRAKENEKFFGWTNKAKKVRSKEKEKNISMNLLTVKEGSSIVNDNDEKTKIFIKTNEKRFKQNSFMPAWMCLLLNDDKFT